MLVKLGIHQLAYDYRAEHIASFDEEVEQLKKHNIKLLAWWFPTQLNDEAKLILSVLEKHKVHAQLWVTGGGTPTQSPEEQASRVEAEADRIRSIAEAAAKIGCSVGLYNHGGWFGEPENQLAIIDKLKMPNVGIVYNQHHGHEHVDRFRELLAKMKPHLYVVNLNGMVPKGDQIDQKIVPLGAGSLDKDLLKIVLDSGYTGPIGILNHTDHDAEARLQDNLDGLDWLVSQLQGKPTAAPKYRTWTLPPKQSLNAKPTSTKQYVSFDANDISKLTESAKSQGNAARGVALFASAKSACVSCHKIGNLGGSVGPDLTSIGKLRTSEQLVESVLWPNRIVEDKYRVTQILTGDGEVLRGYVLTDDEQKVVIADPATGAHRTIAKDEIEDRKQVPSLMPEGLVNAWSEEQLADLISFLTDLGHHERLRPELAESVLQHAQAHDPATFVFDRKPLNEKAWPNWQAPVNRERLYDFYTKQANHFRTQDRDQRLLMDFPGLDGGEFGHWGIQAEPTWASDEWNQAELGSVQSGVFTGPNGLTIARGVCLQLGDSGELFACFDPDTLTYPAVWGEKFLKFSSVRHGFVNGVTPIGTLLAKPDITKPKEPYVYHGFYRVGKRTVFSYRIGNTEYLDAPWVKDGKFSREFAPLDEHSMKDKVRMNSEQAKSKPMSLETAIRRGDQRPYAIDTIELPLNNPWHAPMYIGGHDFLPDGSALVVTMQGDVWHVSGLESDKAVWRRFASGLHHPLGVKIDRDGIFVQCRDQLTRLHDLNQDGEADYYECYSNAFETSPSGHDYICGLERDNEGNFYTASGNQGLVRISSDGSTATTIAEGFRNPDGLGIYPDGVLTVPCSEGEWTAASMICAVNSRRSDVPFYGYRGAKFSKRPVARPELPMVYLPRGLDNSAGGQVFIDSDRWGPLKGNMIHLSFGTGSHFLLLRDQVGDQLQGAVVPMPGEFLSGAHRGRFSPADGQLYVSGMNGWGNYSTEQGCFQRVRYTGDAVQKPIGFHLHSNGVAIQFPSKLDRNFVEQTQEHFAQTWNYRYSAAYGSAEYSALHYGARGHDQLKITSAHVVDDGRTLFLEIPELVPCNQLHLQIATDPQNRVDMFATCNRLDEPRTDFGGALPLAEKSLAHPIDQDMLIATKRVPNPWRHKIDGAREVRIAAGQNLTYDTREFRVQAGEAIKLVFKNPDVVPHNWVLIQPDKLQVIGAEANKIISDPEALIRHYVPQSPEVICFTDIVDGKQETEIQFRVPDQPGRYPYLCTFPGHWMVMNGVMIVQR